MSPQQALWVGVLAGLVVGVIGGFVWAYVKYYYYIAPTVVLPREWTTTGDPDTNVNGSGEICATGVAKDGSAVAARVYAKVIQNLGSIELVPPSDAAFSTPDSVTGAYRIDGVKGANTADPTNNRIVVWAVWAGNLDSRRIRCVATGHTDCDSSSSSSSSSVSSASSSSSLSSSSSS